MDWTPSSLPLLVLVCGTSALFVVLRYLFGADGWARRWPGLAGRLGVNAQASGVLARRVLGGLWLGGGTLALEVVGGGEVGRGLTMPGAQGLAWVAAPLAVLVPLLWRSGATEAVRETQPEIREATWTPRLRALSMGSWLVYLAGYEYLFRGGLLFTLEAGVGAWPAIAVSASLYALAHLHKPMLGEALGSLPMGVLFGAMALATGSFVPALAVHVGIAWTTELSASRR